MTNSPRRSRPRRSVRLAASARIAASAVLVCGAGALVVAAAPPQNAPASNWPELRGDVTRRGVTEEKLMPPLSLLWRFTGGPQSPNPVSPSIVGDTAYFAARGLGEAGGGVLYAIDTRTGARKWQYPSDNNGLRDRNTFQTAPLVADGRVYVGASDGLMYVLDANNGREVVRFRTGRQIASAPALVDGTLYFGSNDGTFYALNPESGEPVWKQLYRAGDGVNSAPILADSFVFFTTNDNNIHAIKQATGIFRWKARLPFRVLANAPIYADNSLFVPNGPRLTAIQPASGSTRWNMDVESDILTAPATEGGVIYVTCRQRTGSGALLYAMRTNNGRAFWSQPAVLPVAPSAAPIISGDVIYIPTVRGVLLAVSREDGHLLWEYTAQPSSARPLPAGYTPPASPFSAALSISSNTLFAVSDDGTLSAFRPDAPDATGPDISGLYPPPGRAVSGTPPVTFAANVLDMGSGLDPASLDVKLDGQKVGAEYDSNRSLVYYQTKASGKIIDRPLENGRHTISISAKDWRGNVAEQNWSFLVNNALPPASATREAPRVTAPRPNPSGSGTPGNPNGGGRRGGGGGRRGNGGTGGGASGGL